jgi:glycosyltransferase involved in cell wall biosynthesis
MGKKKLKDLRVAHLVISMAVGGTEQLVLKLIKAMPQNSVCYCLDTPGPLADEVRLLGVDVFAFNRVPGWDFKVAYKIAVHCQSHKIDILHCHQYSPWFYGVLSKLLNPGIKVIYTEHGRPYPDYSKLIRRVFNVLMSPITNSITSVSPFIKDALTNIEYFPSKKIKVIFNGVESNVVNESKEDARLKLGLESNSVYMILPARFNPIKWHVGLVEAFSKVLEVNKSARLILLGDGAEKERIKDLINKLNIVDYVLMPGTQKNVNLWLKASDIFVLSSLSEGTSVSLIEAMANSLPAVVTDAGGNKYIIENNKTAFLAFHQNVNDLAEKITKLVNDKQLREQMGNAARMRYEEFFTFDKMATSFQNLYIDLK